MDRAIKLNRPLIRRIEDHVGDGQTGTEAAGYGRLSGSDFFSLGTPDVHNRSLWRSIMLKKISILVCLLLAGSAVQAASTAAPTSPTVAASVPDPAPVTADTPNPHRLRDQKLRECRAQAEQQNLVGYAARKFVASCFKKS